jgi:hypothetical protein
MRAAVTLWAVVVIAACGDNLPGECVYDIDCPGDPACISKTCTAGHCNVAPIPDNMPSTVQIAGDCKKALCDGNGNVKQTVDDTDVPTVSGDCTLATCTNGVPYAGPAQAGTSCGANLYCDNSGNCVGCIGALECPGTDTECHARTCINETCGVADTASGHKLATQTKGDCQVVECDGSGSTMSVADNTDVPTTTNKCIIESCVAGVPTVTNQPAGHACGTTSSPLFCDGAGTCVQCNQASDCGTSTDCKTYSCTSHTCSVAFTSAGTPTSAQTPHDCKQNVCDGAGAVVVQNDNTDLPVDGNACTDDVCTNGVPSNPPTAPDTSCGGSLVCDGAGHCVGCVVPADCGTNNECVTQQCTTNVCNPQFTALGTPISTQTAGDCHTVECDGAGGTTNAVDNTDVPVDGNACTLDVCTIGVPSNPPAPPETVCNGTEVCDGAGNCVACDIAADCGVTTDCVTYTCTSHVCSHTFANSGTPTTSQTPGDCHQTQCDGNGGTMQVIDNTDVPVDGNVCTSDVCTAGTPSNPALADGTACTITGSAANRCRTQTSTACVPAVALVLVGDGTTALSGSAAQAAIEERYVSDGALVVETGYPASLPTSSSTSAAACTLTGSAPAEGYLSRSTTNEAYLVMACYDAAPGTVGVGTSMTAAVNRVAARIDVAGTVDTSTRFATAFNGNGVRSAASTDGTALWVAGASSGTSGGTWYTTLGGSSPVQIESTANRVVEIQNSQLYGSTMLSIFSIGSGLPTSSASTTNLPMFGGTGYNPHNYFFSALDTLYVADDGAANPGIQKWTFDGTNWSLAYKFGTASRGMTAYQSGANIIIVAVGAVTAANVVTVWTDTGSTQTSYTLVTAPANEGYRGVALSAH